jgi:hypothetical protein
MSMNARIAILAIAFAMGFAVALPAHAGDALANAEDVPLPPLTPKDQYLVLTQDDATSSSKCIGNPATPMCAVETVIACLARRKHDLCQIGMGLHHDPGLGGKGRGNDMIYTVVRSEVLADKNFPWRPARDLPWRPGEINARAGDARIDVVLNECDGEHSSTANCSFSYGELSYIVRKENGRWAVIVWDQPYDVKDQ